MTKVIILGAGNFGFALTSHLDRKNDRNLDLWLYARNNELVEHIRTTRSHPKFYPTTELSPAVQITSSLDEALADCEVLVLAIASTGLRAILSQIRPLIAKPITIVSIIKALDSDSGQILSDVIGEELADLPVTIAALAGGTTGTALTQEQYLGATLACEDGQMLGVLKNIFQSSFLRIQTTADLRGVQYAGSLKNVISVMVGLVKGLGFAYGTQTHALSLLATECERFATIRGAKRETFSFASQCWGNDMVMSATDPDTRNHQFGILLGEGLRFSQAVEKMLQDGKTAEGANTLLTLSRQNLDVSAFPLLNFLRLLSTEKVAAGEVVKLIETYP